MADDIIVRVRAEGTGDFIKKLKEAGVTVEETGEKVKKTEKKSSASFKKIGAAVGAAFATAAIIDFGKELARTAVDIDATAAKVSKVFGQSAKDIDRFAKESANSLGLTTNEFKKAAAAVGDLLIPIGFQRKEAAKLSSDLIKLSGALSAWTGNQLNAKEVSDILTKALLGEREQLKQLGVQISEADVKAKLLEKGQSKLTGTTLAQAKATATLELIYAKTADAQAAFSDGTKTLAEQQIALSATIREVKDRLATALIPTLSQAAVGLERIFDAVEAIQENKAGFVNLTKEELDAELEKNRELEKTLKLQFGTGQITEKQFDKRIAQVQEYKNEIIAARTALVRSGQTGARIQKPAIEATEKVIEVNKELEKQRELNAKQEAADEAEQIERAKEILRLEFELRQALIARNKIVAELDPIGFSGDLDTDLSDSGAIDRIKARAEKEKEIARDLEEAKKQFAIDTANAIFSIGQSVGDRRIQNLEEQKEKGVITEKEFQEEVAEIRRKQAIADKAQAAFNIAISTAQSIGKTAAQLGFPAAIPFVALAAATGALQLATVLAQPIPQFAKGTKGKRKAPSGFAWVGEEGAELVQMKGGEKVITAGDSEELMRLLGGYSIPVQFKSTASDLYKPMKTIQDITSNTAFDAIDWNPLLNASDTQRRSLGKKLDILHLDLMKVNNGLSRRMTKN